MRFSILAIKRAAGQSRGCRTLCRHSPAPFPGGPQHHSDLPGDNHSPSITQQDTVFSQFMLETILCKDFPTLSVVSSLFPAHLPLEILKSCYYRQFCGCRKSLEGVLTAMQFQRNIFLKPNKNQDNYVLCSFLHFS